MNIFEDCIKEIRLFCRSVAHIPNEYAALIDGWIDCLNEWSCDKTPLQVESLFFLILSDYTGDIYRDNWESEQVAIVLEVLETFGYAGDVDNFYYQYDGRYEEFDHFWRELNIPQNTLEDINRESSRCSYAYFYLQGQLEKFAEHHKINFAEYARRAEWHEDFISKKLPPIDNLQESESWQNYIIGANKDAWINLIREELNNAGNKNGRLMAVIILALQKNSAIKTLTSKKRFYDALRAEFPNLNRDQAINNYLNAESPNSYTTPIPEDEIIAIINKIGCH